MNPMNYSDREKGVISTLLYYKTLGEFPLTAFEVYGRLNRVGDAPSPSYGEILNILRVLQGRGVVSSQNGFFYLAPIPEHVPVAKRIKRYKISIGKIKRLRRALFFLRTLPFVNMIGVTGSVSLHNADEESDIDVLVITERGRIWTARILCSALTHFLGMRRYGKRTKDRICLNHYIAEGALTLKVQNLSNAHTYASLIPAFDGKNGCYQEFQNKNRWMNRYLAHHPWQKERSLILHPSTHIVSFVSSLFQSPVFSRSWDALENIFQYLQKGRILRNISEIRSIHENQLILSSDALMFHYPISRNKEVEKKYQEEMERLGIE